MKFLCKSITSNLLEKLQLIKSILNVKTATVFSVKKKTSCIPPLINNNNIDNNNNNNNNNNINNNIHQFVADFKAKIELFNSFFANKCTHIEIGSSLTTQLLRRTNESLSTVNFTEAGFYML